MNAVAETITETVEPSPSGAAFTLSNNSIDPADMEILRLEESDILVRLETDRLGRIDVAVSLDEAGVSAQLASEDSGSRDSLDSAIAQCSDRAPPFANLSTTAWSDRRQPPPQASPPSETERSATPHLPDVFTHRPDRKPPHGTVHVYA